MKISTIVEFLLNSILQCPDKIEYKLRNSISLNFIMKLADIRKNIVTTYHYTTIGGEELVFENESDCYKAREKDIRQWHSRLISNEYLNCANGVYLIKCKREMYLGKNFLVFNGMVVCDNVYLDTDGKIEDFDGNTFLIQVGRF